MTRINRSASITLSSLTEGLFFVLLIALGVLCIDTSTPDSIAFMVVEYLDSARYSQIVGGLLAFTAAGHIVWRVLPGRGRERPSMPWSVLAGMAGSAIYALGLVYVGFYVSTFLFLATCCRFMAGAEGGIRAPALFALASTAAMYVLFRCFSIYLPPAWLF